MFQRQETKTKQHKKPRTETSQYKKVFERSKEMPCFVGQQMLFKSFFKNITMWVLLPKIGECVGDVCLNSFFMISEDMERRKEDRKKGFY